MCAADASYNRLYQFTQLNNGSIAGNAAWSDLVSRSCVTIDDNSSVQNPNPITVGGVYNLQDVVLRGGSQVTNLVGPLSYQFSAWYIQPAKQADLIIKNLFTPQRPLPTSFPTGTSDVRLVFSNLLNYFTTLNAGSNVICNGLAPRGANSITEFYRQTNKTILALTTINADIFMFSELQNCPESSIDILSRMNAANPQRLYKAVSLEKGYTNIGSDAIKVEIVYDSTKFDLLGAAILDDKGVAPAILAQAIDGFIFSNGTYGRSRVPLAATFQGKQAMRPITIVANHFKSKSCSDTVVPGSGLDVDQNDGQGCWNYVRTLSARAVIQWLGTTP